MTNPFAKPVGGGGNFFKAADHVADVALVIEPKSVARDVKNEYEGRVSYRDEVTADISIFRNSEDVDKRQPSVVLKGAKITNKALTGEAEQHIGGAPLLVVVRKVKNYYVFTAEGVTPEAEAAAIDWFTNREKAVQAAIADAPGFDD